MPKPKIESTDIVKAWGQGQVPDAQEPEGNPGEQPVVAPEYLIRAAMMGASAQAREEGYQAGIIDAQNAAKSEPRGFKRFVATILPKWNPQLDWSQAPGPLQPGPDALDKAGSVARRVLTVAGTIAVNRFYQWNVRRKQAHQGGVTDEGKSTNSDPVGGDDVINAEVRDVTDSK